MVDTHEPDLIDPGPWFEMHGDILSLPPGATLLARNGHGIQAFERGKALGVQFHPEVSERHVKEWPTAEPELMARAGADPPPEIMARTAEIVPVARRRAGELFDRAWERIGG